MLNAELLLSVFLGLILSLTRVGILFAIMQIISRVDHDSNTLIIPFISLMLATASVFVFKYLYETLIRACYRKISLKNMSYVMRRILDGNPCINSSISSGELMQAISAYESAQPHSLSGLVSLSGNVIYLSALVLYIFFYDFKIAFLVCIAITIILFIRLKLNSLCAVYHSKYIELQGKLSSFLSDIYLQIEKIRTVNMNKWLEVKWLQHVKLIKIVYNYTIKLNIISKSIDMSVPVIGCLILYFVLSSAPATSPSLIMTMMFVISQMTYLSNNIVSDIACISHSNNAFERIKPLINPTTNKESDKILKLFTGKIEVKNVSLLNRETGQYIFDKLCMQIPQGSLTGIIGPSGSGKSTLLRLMLGLVQPDSGSIYYDGENIQHLNLKHSRQAFGVVLQTSCLFPGTILSNMSVNRELTLEEAWELAAMVGFDQEIKRMPMQMYTQISDNPGESLSGGQIQKILIARALSTRPKVLLLDEATSALDNHSQTVVQNALASLHITRVVIAHRHSTLTGADQIYDLKRHIN